MVSKGFLVRKEEIENWIKLGDRKILIEKFMLVFRRFFKYFRMGVEGC